MNQPGKNKLGFIKLFLFINALIYLVKVEAGVMGPLMVLYPWLKKMGRRS